MPTSRFPFAILAVALLIATLCLSALSGCPRPVRAGDASSSATIGGASSGAKPAESTAPAKKLKIPRNVERELEFPASYTLKEVTDTPQSAHIVFTVKPPRTEEIAQFYISDLETKGYHSDDNASRILEGVTYTGGGFQSITIQVTETYEEGTVVTIDVVY